jgi:hypothetical protein
LKGGEYNLEQFVALLEFLEQHADLCVIGRAGQHGAHLALELLHFHGGKKVRRWTVIQPAGDSQRRASVFGFWIAGPRVGMGRSR